MNIYRISEHVGVMSNREVLDVIKKSKRILDGYEHHVKTKKGKSKKIIKNMDDSLNPTAWINDNVLKYLKGSQCFYQTRNQTKNVLKRLNQLKDNNNNKIKLSMLDKLNIVNNRPDSISLLNANIMNIDGKMDKNSKEKLIKMITKYPGRPNDDNGSSNDEDNKSDNDEPMNDAKIKQETTEQ